MKDLFLFRLSIIMVFTMITSIIFSQGYSTTLDTFYVQSPEYSASINVDSLPFPCAITRPDTGSDFPLLILVHGTSALDKNASSTKDYLDSIGATYRKAETRMFYEIADSLSRNGIAVLRYDKRSFTLNCIEQPACWFVDTISPYDYIEDIHHAVEYGKALADIDTCNIFLAGHSQGGSFVSQVGFDRDDIRGILNMAGTAQPIDSVVIYQKEFIDNDPAGAIIISEQFDSLRAGLWPMTDTLYNTHFSPKFWLHWLSHTDSAMLVQKTSDKPTALMYGTADRFVPSNIHYQLWQDSITRPNVTFELFTDIDHSFGSEYDSTMSPQVLQFMTDWIHSTSQNCGPAGLDNLSSTENVTMFPNPASTEITVLSNESSRFKIIDIYNRIYSTGLLESKISHTIDIQGLSTGIYFIQTAHSMLRFIKL